MVLSSFDLLFKVSPHLLILHVFHATHQGQIETNSKTALEEEGWPTAVQLTFGKDGDPVTQEVSLVHVMGGQDHSTAYKTQIWK